MTLSDTPHKRTRTDSDRKSVAPHTGRSQAQMITEVEEEDRFEAHFIILKLSVKGIYTVLLESVHARNKE